MKLAEVRNQEENEMLNYALKNTSGLELCQTEFTIGLESCLGKL